MVSFSCEGCGDVLTKKKLDPHRNQCWGATYTCLDCMTHFPGTSYRSHTSCISEDQKYQGKLYREKKPKGQQNQNNSQALVQTQNAYNHNATDNSVAVVDAPPRAPTPPPAAKSLGHEERAALPPVNVFDFLDTSAARADETRMIEDSIPPPYEDEQYKENGFAYGNGTVYATQETDPNFTTPAPKKSKKSKDVDTTTTKSDRKRKRNSPSELDMDAVRAQQDRDVTMSDAPTLHSGLTGGLNRLLARPEFPPSPELSGDRVENSPLSPMKRAKQGHSKAFLRAQKDWDNLTEKERKAEVKAEKEKEKEKEKERGRGKERKSKEKSKDKKRRDSSRKARDSDRRRKRAYSSSASPEPGMKAIEYKPEGATNGSGSNSNGAGALIVRSNGDLVPAKTGEESRAELFLAIVNKGPDSGRGMSVNKALKRYHRDQSHRSRFSKADEEKELWKNLRLKRNEQGEVVVFFAAGAGVDE